jgi:hypothetical protein
MARVDRVYEPSQRDGSYNANFAGFKGRKLLILENIYLKFNNFAWSDPMPLT